MEFVRAIASYTVQDNMLPMTLHIGDTAPDFEALTTIGRLKFHGWIGDSYRAVLAFQGLHACMHDGTWLYGQDQIQDNAPSRVARPTV